MLDTFSLNELLFPCNFHLLLREIFECRYILHYGDKKVVKNIVVSLKTGK